MHFADVERIVVRGDREDKWILGREIVGGLVVVVVVTDGVVNSEVAERAVHQVEVLGKLEVVVVPVYIPCHVAESDCVSFSGLTVCIHIVGKVSELLHVVGTVCEVHIAEEKHAVVALVCFHEREVDILWHCTGRIESEIVDGENTRSLGLISRRHRHEYISERFFRLEFIATEFVGHSEVHTIANHHSGHRTFGRSNGTVYGSAIFNFPLIGNDLDNQRAEELAFGATLDVDTISAFDEAVGKDKCERVGCYRANGAIDEFSI